MFIEEYIITMDRKKDGRVDGKKSIDITLSNLNKNNRRTYGFPKVNHFVPHYVVYPAHGSNIKTGISHERFE